MKRIKLTQGKYAIVDNKDYDLLNQHKWYANKIKGIWYACRGVREPKIKKGVYGKVKRVLMHRVITGAKKRWDIVDHKNHNGLDNRNRNLKITTNSGNLLNHKNKAKPRRLR